MPLVNQFQGLGGIPAYGNWQNMSQPYAAIQNKPLYDHTRPNGDCLKRVNGMQSAMQFHMNPNSRDVVFDENEDIFYIVTSDASGINSVQAFSFTPFQPENKEEAKYVTVEEFNKFKEEVLNGQQFVRSNRNTRNNKSETD